jgi:hypothetical protein
MAVRRGLRLLSEKDPGLEARLKAKISEGAV